MEVQKDGEGGPEVGTRLRMALALACALAAGAAFVAYADGVRGEAERVRSEALARYGGEVVELAVATRSLEVGSVVGAGDIEMREWLADLAPEGAVTSLDDVMGAEVTVPVAKGAAVTSLNFRGATDSADVPSGHVAVTIPVTDKLGIPREVAVGSRVVGYRVSDGGSSLVAAEMVVISASGGQGMSTAQSVTVAVLPQDVSALLTASSSGELRLVMPAEDVDAIPDDVETQAPSSVPSEKED